MKKSILGKPQTKKDSSEIINEWNKINNVCKIHRKYNTKKEKICIDLISKYVLKLNQYITSKSILDSIKIFGRIQEAGGNKIFDIDKRFLTLINFLYIDYNEFDEINFNNRYGYIELDSESFCLDCLSGNINKYKKENYNYSSPYMKTIYVVKRKAGKYCWVNTCDNIEKKLEELQEGSWDKLFLSSFSFKLSIKQRRSFFEYLDEYSKSGNWFECEENEIIKELEKFKNT